MFIDKDSVVINGVSMGKYCVEAKFGYHKIWGKDSGRNLAGSMTGTLIGIFPKITLQYGRLTKEDLNLLAPILDAPEQTLQYYDPNKNKKITMKTYSNDWEVISKRINNLEGFSCAFISRHKRS